MALAGLPSAEYALHFAAPGRGHVSLDGRSKAGGCPPERGAMEVWCIQGEYADSGDAQSIFMHIDGCEQCDG